jgi:hypothetical protein
MSMADAGPPAGAARDDAPPDDKGTPYRKAGVVPPSSPGLSAGWLLRVTAFAAVAAGVMGVVVAPGVRGNASEQVVNLVDRGSATLSYFLLLGLVALVGWGAFELVRERDGEAIPRLALVGSSAAVVALVLVGVALHDRNLQHTETATLITAAGAGVCVIAGAYVAARAPHTRAAAAVLIVLAFAALARLGGWELAKSASDQANVRLYSFSRGLATAGVLLEGAAQLVAIMWLWARSRLAGQMGVTVALAGALILTWGVAKGMYSDAPPWQAMLHTALADAPGIPPPFWIDRFATLVVPLSLLLALVTAGQPGQVAAVVATVSLALVSRGAFDAPLRALCAVAAAQWAALSSGDERAMWRALIDDRKRRLADGLGPDA